MPKEIDLMAKSRRRVRLCWFGNRIEGESILGRFIFGCAGLLRVMFGFGLCSDSDSEDE